MTTSANVRRKTLGVLVPYFNSVVEPELADLRPAGVTNQTARFTLDADVQKDIVDSSEKLAACGVEAILIGLSTEFLPGGLELLAAGVQELTERTGLPVFTASHAAHAALRHLALTRIAIVTPFDDAANEHVRASFADNGFEVTATVGLACPDLAKIAAIDPAEIRRAFEEGARSGPDAVVQVGTGLPVVHHIAALERDLGLPVVACNAALYWQALRGTGIDDAVEGFGRLLAGR